MQAKCLNCQGILYRVSCQNSFQKGSQEAIHKSIGLYCKQCNILFIDNNITVLPFLEEKQLTLEGEEQNA
jgi:hypothetical protein